MSEFKFSVRPLTTFEAFEKLSKVAAEAFPQREVGFSAATNIGTVGAGSFVSDQFADNPAVQARIAELRTRPYVDFESVSLNNAEPSDAINIHGARATNGPYIGIHLRQDHSRLPAIADALAKQFTLIPHAEAVASALPAELQEMMRLSRKIIADFAGEAAKLSQSATAQTEEFAKALRERTVELDERAATKEAELDSRYQDRVKELEEREKRHAETVKDFETRSNTYVRRDLFEKLRKSLLNRKRPSCRRRRIRNDLRSMKSVC